MTEPYRPPPRPGSRPRHRRPPRLRWGRLTLLLVTILLTAVGGWILATDGSARSSSASAQTGSHSSTSGATSTTTSTTTTTVPPTTTTTVDPGTLPQTDDFPSAGTPQFSAEMSALWNGIVTDSVQAAMPAFFPESAYVQLKTIGDPQDDFTNRLVYEYGLDIGAAHALLGADASQAQLVAVDVDASYGHWITPGVCDNSIGYFEVPNSRVIYQENGQTASFGIASMISWRGEWYVVHFGAILRSSETGVVEDPEPGTGTPTPSSTC